MRTEDAFAPLEKIGISLSPSRATIGPVRMHFMEDFAERSWIVGLQNPTRARTEAE